MVTKLRAKRDSPDSGPRSEYWRVVSTKPHILTYSYAASSFWPLVSYWPRNFIPTTFTPHHYPYSIITQHHTHNTSCEHTLLAGSMHSFKPRFESVLKTRSNPKPMKFAISVLIRTTVPSQKGSKSCELLRPSFQPTFQTTYYLISIGTWYVSILSYLPYLSIDWRSDGRTEYLCRLRHVISGTVGAASSKSFYSHVITFSAQRRECQNFGGKFYLKTQKAQPLF